MAKIGGYAGKILYVDLTRKTSETGPLSKELMKNFIGGPGINSRLAYDIIKPKTEFNSTENAILINVPPLVGTFAPGAGRVSFMSISPQTGSLAYSGTGGLYNLKFAGYDELVITGKADGPVYLKVLDDEVEILDASDLWGKDAMETTDILWSKYGDEWNVACIGPAGENLVRYASINSNKFSLFAREGFGAVMGSKNLKAIVARGTKDIEIADRSKFRELCSTAQKDIMGERYFPAWRALGSLIGLGHFERSGLFPVKNQQEGCFDGVHDNLFRNAEFISRLKNGDVSCMACPVGCKHAIKVKGGKYDGKVASLSCILSTIQTFGITYTIKNYDETIMCADLCDRYGMDYFSIVNTVAYATELYDRGILTQKDTDGMVLEWGSADLMHELIPKIALRQGFGDLLAEGCRRMGQTIGGDAPKYAVHVKGVDTIYDPRTTIFSPEMFSLFTNTKGAYPTLQTFSLGTVMSPETLKLLMKIIGVPENRQDVILNTPTGGNEGGYNVPRLTKYYDEFYSLLDSTGICARSIYNVFGANRIARIYSALTGIEKDAATILTDMDRRWNVEKAFKVREGLGRKEEDMGPERWMTETVSWKGKEFGPISRERLSALLSEYYDERGWDRKSGWPTKRKLEQLELADIAKDLQNSLPK
jgi:aldehyde:ferredoxin oxidoreductase